MELNTIPLMSMLRERMSWLNQRQDMLSQNVANADTPGYVAHDMKPLDFQNALSEQNSPMHEASLLTITNPRQIQIQPAQLDSFQRVVTHDTEGTPSGNTVGLEQEMIKVADTQAQFQAASNLYAKALSMMRTAIGH